MPILGIIAILVFCYFIAWLFEIIENFFIFMQPLWGFIGDNFFFAMAVILWVFAIFVFIYFKPHPAEKHFIAYKNNQISRQTAIRKISSTMYNPRRDGLSSRRKSKIYERRIKALRKRVNAEKDFIDDLRHYMRAKSALH